ncbi:MAG: glycosyltransferase family 39 protein [bacterium]|nr:glycosyltransferase family 39 protein [bacterium]
MPLTTEHAAPVDLRIQRNEALPLLALVGCLLVGLGLLLSNGERGTLWSDEAWSAVVVQQPTFAGSVAMVAQDFHPPLYFILTRVWQTAAGDSVFALRHLSILMTLFGAATLYGLAKDLFNPKTALLGVGLYLLHDLVLTLGQEVRPYALAQMLTLLTVWAYWRFWKQPNIRWGIVYILSGAALLWTLYWGGFILLALGVHALITRRNSFLRFVLVNAAIALLFVPWLPQLIAMLQRTPDGLNHTLVPSSDGYAILAFQLLGLPQVFWSILAFIGIFSLTDGKNRWRLTPQTLLLALIVLGTIGLSVIINLGYQSLSYRSLSLIVPALIVLIAHALASFRPYEGAVVSIIAVSLSLSMTASESPARVESFPEIAQFLGQHRTAADLIVSDMQWESYQLAYNLNRLKEPLPSFLAEFELRQFSPEDATFRTYLNSTLADYRGLWIVALDNYSTDDRSRRYDLSSLLTAEGFQPTAHLTWQDAFLSVRLRRYDRLTSGSPLVQYASGMNLLHSEIVQQADGVTVNLWWQSQTAITRDYIVSAFLLDEAGGLVVQHDSPPLNGYAPTSTWTAGSITFDSHFLPLDAIPTGRYEVGFQVYALDATNAVENLRPVECESEACQITILGIVEVSP